MNKFSSASGGASESSLMFYACFIAIDSLFCLSSPLNGTWGVFAAFFRQMLRLCQTRIAETGQGFVMQTLM